MSLKWYFSGSSKIHILKSLLLESLQIKCERFKIWMRLFSIVLYI